MKVLVTGATGFIGSAVCLRLVSLGHEVIALYRDARLLAPIDHQAIQPIQGDITNCEDVLAAIQDCDGCIHLAAIAKPWAKQNELFQSINVDGTKNVFTAALNAGAKRVVFASTASVFGPATANAPISESCLPNAIVDSDYERSKQDCETVIRDFRSRGLDIITLYPSRVYGPGVLNQSNALTTIIKQFEQRRWRLIPGTGKSVGNYVFIDDVVEAHVRAMTDSEPNQSYLVGGENLSFNQIVSTLKQTTGNSQRMLKIPGWMLIAFANLQLLKANSLGLTPSITPAFAKKYLKDWHLDGSKIRNDLEISQTSFAAGVQQTVDWIRDQKKRQ